MLRLVMIKENDKPTPELWVGQVLHGAALVVLLIVLALMWMLLGTPFFTAFWIAVAIPVFHQVFVWIAWRLELRSSAISKTIGFRGYLVVFFGLFVGRFLALLVLAYLDRGSLGLGASSRITVSVALMIPGIYAIYSVHRYFGLARAAGADHFEERYRHMPLVKNGIFRYTENGMYLYAFMCFWAIAIGFNSVAAFIVAAFSHVYIWVHFFATEKPDMEYLYTSKETN